MKYSMCADIMFVAPGEHGPIWPDADGIRAAMVEGLKKLAPLA